MKQKAQAYHYRDVLSKLTAKTALPYPLLAQTSAQISSNPDIPAYILQTVQAKLDQAKPKYDALIEIIYTAPEQTNKISGLLQAL